MSTSKRARRIVEMRRQMAWAKLANIEMHLRAK